MSDDRLPPNWVPITLGDAIISMKNGIYKQADAYTNEGVPCLRMYNIADGRLVWRDIKQMILRQDEVEAYGLCTGDLLVNRVNSRELVGKTCVIPAGIGACVFESKNIRVRLDSRLFTPQYANYALLLGGRAYFSSACQQTVGMATISQPQIAGFPIHLAPLPEQRRIVEKIEELFSRLDAGVAALERVRANLKRYRAAVLKAAVEGKLTEQWRAAHPDTEPASVLLERILRERHRKWEEGQLARFAEKGTRPPKNWQAKYKEPQPPDTTGLPDVPQGWVWATLDAISELAGGITKGQKRNATQRLRAVPYLRVANVQRGFLDLSEIKTIAATEDEIRGLRLVPGDILFTEGGDRDKLGRGWVWRGEIGECVHQNHIFRARLHSAGMCPELVSWHGNSFGQAWFTIHGKQTVNLASINLTTLRSFPVPIPPASEQEQLVSEIERRLSVLDEIEHETEAALKRAARLRQSILKRAFEGRLVPQDPNDEPASVLLERIKAERGSVAPSARRSRKGYNGEGKRNTPGVAEDRHSKGERSP